MNRPRAYLPLLLLATATLSACSGANSPVGTAQAATAPNFTNAEVIREALRTAGAPGPATDVRPSPITGFQEAVVNGQVVYVSNDGKRLFLGDLIDVASQDNLTDVAEARLHAKLLAEVGMDHRIVFAAAKPKHRITVFTDLDCGYCRKLHSEVAELNQRGITVEYLPYPRGGIDSPSYATSVSVWCSDDRKRALTDAKAGRQIPHRTCANSVALDYTTGLHMGMHGTPGIFAENGMQIGGYLPPDALLARLDREAARKVR